MSAQMERPRGHGHQLHEEDTHSAGLRSVVEGGGDVHHGYDDEHHHDHEKKSVMKKVKAKAKKLKDTIRKHGHGHDHGDMHGHEEEDDDDEDEEIEEDAEIHGAPMYESKEAQSYAPGQLGASIQHDVMSAGGHQTSSAMPLATDHHGTNLTDVNAGLTTGEPELRDHRSFIPEQVGVSKQNGVTFGGSQTPTPQVTVGSQTGVGRRTTEPANQSGGYPGGVTHVQQQGIPTQEGGIFDRPSVLQPDPHAPREDREPDNYQSKVTDPTGKGGEEIGVTPILHSLNKMSIFDKSEQQNAGASTGQQESLVKPTAGLAVKEQSPFSGTGSHDQFSPEPMSDETGSFVQKPESEYGLSRSSTEKGRGHDETAVSKAQHAPSYTEKVSYATSVVADKAIQAKNVVASKLGYGGDDQKKTPNTMSSQEGEDEARKTSSVTEYGKKVGSTVQAKLAPVMSKLRGSGPPQEGGGGAVKGPADKGVSVKEYIAEKLSPREEDKVLSEVIGGALHKGSSKEGEMKAEPTGRVTVSAQVARQLGTGDEKSVEEVGLGGSSPGRAMVDRLKGAVTSWWGKGGENEPSSVAFHDTAKGSEGFTGDKLQMQGTHVSGGEPRLQ